MGNMLSRFQNKLQGQVVSAKQTLNSKTSSSVATTVTQGSIPAPTIHAVTTDSTTVTGTGVAGATVTLTIGGIDYTGTVDADGNYAIAILKQAVGTIITATETLNGITSGPTITTVTQGTVAAPTLNSLTTEDTTARGTGITGAVVTITIGSNTYTGTVSNGEYAITIPKQVVGTVVSAKQTLHSKTSSSVNTTVTQGAIAAPTISAVTTDDTSVKGTGVVGATVTITIGSNTYTGTVAANGSYAITIPKQPFGTTITAKQALNEKTSTNASTTVTQGIVAAPTINAVTTDDTTVTGTGITGAVVTLTIGTNTYTGTVTGGNYTITIPKQATGTVISAKQTLNSQTSTSVTTTVTSTETTLTANNFTIGTDNYIRGTYTGSSVAKLAIEVNGTVQQQITATGSPYQYYAKGKVTAATDEVYVISYNANGDQLKRVKVGVKALTSGTITPDTFYVGTDNYVTGTLTGDVSKISLTINGVETTKINVTTAPTFRYYANNLIRSLTDIVTVNGYDSAGELLDSKPVTVSQDRGNPGTITSVTPFKIGKDSYINGTYTGDIAKVELQVNNTVLQRINVSADGTIKYYAKGKITETTDVVKLVGYNTAGVAVSTKVVTISDADGSITANPYVIGTDSYVKGTYTGDVAKISLAVNGDKKTTITVPAPGPNYQYYAKSLITEATDIVVVTAYDATGGVLDTKTVAISKPTVVTTGTVTPNAYKIGTNTYVDGTYTGDVAKVAVEVNGVLSNPIPATGNVIHYYAGALITDKDDVVYAIVYDATGKELDKKRVTITAPEGTVTANTLKTTDSYLTGSATGDVTKVTLTVNDVKQASITVVQPDGTYRYYVKPLALTSTDIVKVIGLDSRGNEITTATVTITN
ncbi:immunoglobulin-like domain-containing protein [Listeria booriae]|uniref:immunoglobulin-like domain-containing protein n=1 Tax=Listeria booriae TaxID=1552123 RepID=UPI00164ED956|nr:immunoglobulin-like domain-containing protein [Listeria booriae]